MIPKSNTLYQVEMQRYSDNEKHHYTVGVFSTYQRAYKAGEKERIYRGGHKYFPEVRELIIDKEYIEDHKECVLLYPNREE